MTATHDMFGGLSGLEMEEETYDLGEGVSLSKTYAHLMAPFLMAFKPAPPGSHHPGPWKSAGGGFEFDIEAEIRIPAVLDGKYGTLGDIGRTILFLLRLGIHPAIRLPAYSNHSFSTLAETPESDTWLRPYDFEPRYFPLDGDQTTFGEAQAEWIKDRWKIAQRLSKENSAFALAASALDRGQYVHSTALSLVSLWAAIEALFSPSTSELRFRVSALVASYLEPPGNERIKLQREVAKLYDKRSAAAHGKPSHENEHLLETFNLLGRILRKMIDDGAVPNKEALDAALFGSAV